MCTRGNKPFRTQRCRPRIPGGRGSLLFPGLYPTAHARLGVPIAKTLPFGWERARRCGQSRGLAARVQPVSPDPISHPLAPPRANQGARAREPEPRTVAAAPSRPGNPTEPASPRLESGSALQGPRSRPPCAEVPARPWAGAGRLETVGLAARSSSGRRGRGCRGARGGGFINSRNAENPGLAIHAEVDSISGPRVCGPHPAASQLPRLPFQRPKGLW